MKVQTSLEWTRVCCCPHQECTTQSSLSFHKFLGEHILNCIGDVRNVVLGRIVFQTHEFLFGRVGEQSPSWRPSISETFWIISGAEESLILFFGGLLGLALSLKLFLFFADCLDAPSGGLSRKGARQHSHLTSQTGRSV